MINSFEALGLNANLIQGLMKEGITEPTAIQIQTIPLALANKDVIGQSHTGSGKTLAFLLPVFQKINLEKKEMQALILAPTHELVMQIEKQIKTLSENADVPVTSAAIIGEANITRQIEKLKDKPHIIVGSTGRILELIKKKKINTQTIKTIIIDEGDRLLDQNNIVGIKDVIRTTMKDRQLMVFSANINEKTLNISKELMKDAEVIKIDDNQLINPNITHTFVVSEQRDKLEVLRKLVAAIKPHKAIIFINRTEEIKETAAKLQYHNLKAQGIYGEASKEERKKALDGFRNEEYQLLVASDIAARGLDIKGVTHIFNLDLPEDSKEYLHRVGRTGRNGEFGTAISIASERETTLLRKYEKDFKIQIFEKEVFKGEVKDPYKGKPIAQKVIKNKTSDKSKK